MKRIIAAAALAVSLGGCASTPPVHIASVEIRWHGDVSSVVVEATGPTEDAAIDRLRWLLTEGVRASSASLWNSYAPDVVVSPFIDAKESDQ